MQRKGTAETARTIAIPPRNGKAFRSVASRKKIGNDIAPGSATEIQFASQADDDNRITGM